ncbi:hypothetical protein M9M90_01140 [Phenylobacterium sp. LH3H17]|uniref:hypothetical protein n=1 Tax=Phenylobacterium sp. LH3H17 TaxID=2903901 RepID=UPI0020C9DAE0|nr:hypothetical protein [Phenylobacterium sp. LH3H17]UTP39809.1 hypothetical protein M9M90_01140 [Phenylobacterium sp. LH3H17]
MLRLDLSYFYRLSTTLNSVRYMASDVSVGDVWFELHAVLAAVKQLFTDATIKGCFRSSLSHGYQVYNFVEAITQRKWEDPFSNWDKAQLINLMNSFEIVLTSELAVTDSYIVVEKPPYSTISLIAAGEDLFPADIKGKVPDAVDDMREAGKCLAFELSTACGFHTLRAVEAVLRRYWEVVTGNLPKPKQRNIGVYLHALKSAGCGDAKVIAALQQLKDLHRNVIFHPEETLTVEQAISLVGLSRSVVGAMLAELPVVVLPQSDAAPMIDFSSDVEATEAADTGDWNEIDKAADAAALATDAAAALSPHQ